MVLEGLKMDFDVSVSGYESNKGRILDQNGSEVIWHFPPPSPYSVSENQRVPITPQVSRSVFSYLDIPQSPFVQSAVKGAVEHKNNLDLPTVLKRQTEEETDIVESFDPVLNSSVSIVSDALSRIVPSIHEAASVSVNMLDSLGHRGSDVPNIIDSISLFRQDSTTISESSIFHGNQSIVKEFEA